MGSEIRFDMTYSAILSAMTSPYVHKKMIEGAADEIEDIHEEAEEDAEETATEIGSEEPPIQLKAAGRRGA